MATITTFVDGDAVPKALQNQPITLCKICDLSKLAAAPAALDVVQLARIPDDAFIKVLAVVNITADTSLTDMDIGITGVDANGFDDAVSMANAINAANTNGVAMPASGTDQFANGYVNINGDDTIDAVLTSGSTGDGKLALFYQVVGLGSASLG